MAFEYLDNLYKELKEEGKLETNLPMKLFFEEYHQKKDTHSLSTLADLDSKYVEEVLYIELNEQEVKDLTKIIKFKNVKYLSLYNCPIKNLEGIEQLNKLQFLDISNSYDKKMKLQISSFSISKLINLIELHLRNNQLSGLDLSRLVNLQQLNLWGNQLIEINLNELINLQQLNLFGNQLTEINLSGLMNLQQLDLRHNQLTEINLSRLVNLQQLHLGSNQLTTIDLNGLMNLQSLHLSSNQLSSLDLSGLVNLQKLDLSNNRLISLDLSGLDNLQELDLSSNQLISLDLGGLGNLQSLDLSSNKIDEVSNHITDSENSLQFFMIHANPLSKMPEGFVSWGLSKQMRYLNQQRGYGYFYAHWDMPEEVAILFSTYLGRFKNIVREKTGKEIHFEIQTEANGLRLVTKAGKDFSLEEINGMLFYYMAKLANQSSLESQKLEDEIRNLKFRLERTEFENKELNIEISLFKKENIDLRGEKDDLQGKLISLHEQTLSFVMKIQQPQNKHESVTFSIPQFTEILATLKPSTTMIDISPEFKNIGNPQVTNTNTNTNTNSLSSSQEFSVEAFRKEMTPFISRLNVMKEDLEEAEKSDEIKSLLEEITKLLKSAENVAKEEDKEKIKSSSFWTRLGSFYQKTKTEVGSLIKYLTPDNIKKVQESAKLLGKLTVYEFEGSE
ncbi:MAG: leucine-rich repeat domain-containing protein [Thermoflexibacter sp.]|jgi:Leucine-rich repeat (LRR) protein|nr:leucine-rich repeat domain-containing protein [Thermoflexibacter sp.]